MPARARDRDPRERLARKVESIREQPQCLLALGRILDPAQHLTCSYEGLLPIGGSVELEPHAIDDVALRSCESLFEAFRSIRRVLSRRQGDDAHVEAARRRELHATEGRILARRIRVE